MEQKKPTDDDSAMRCEPMEGGDSEHDAQELDGPPPADDRTLEEAGYGYGV